MGLGLFTPTRGRPGIEMSTALRDNNRVINRLRSVMESETADWVCWWIAGRLYQGLGYRTPREVVVDGALVVL